MHFSIILCNELFDAKLLKPNQQGIPYFQENNINKCSFWQQFFCHLFFILCINADISTLFANITFSLQNYYHIITNYKAQISSFLRLILIFQSNFEPSQIYNDVINQSQAFCFHLSAPEKPRFVHVVYNYEQAITCEHDFSEFL